jgi:2-polyprenyl-3-methyl-5-hydroxy-6-metoxy-1,4-benzoquinol methylase
VLPGLCPPGKHGSVRAGIGALPRARREEWMQRQFAFGENWADYARTIGDPELTEAKQALLKLLPAEELAGRSFLDIGSGSGLHSLAALDLGCSKLVAVDLDENSVATTRALLSRHAPQRSWDCRQKSVFDLEPQRDGRFGVVYSWGVLHHTGNMRLAIERATAMVEPGGYFVVALYRKTRFCGFWKVEKRLYSRAPRLVQKAVQAVYVAAFSAALTLKGESAVEHFGQQRERGMSWRHDVHDWLGGYPYESIAADDAVALLRQLGFSLVRSFVKPPSVGRFGTGCDEFVFRRGA